MSPAPLAGLLVVDKPSGVTSHDVVDQVRQTFSIKKVGHGGTLDPLATGVLLVGVGKATRLLTFLHRLDKVYRATVKFGSTTSTQDSDGEVLDVRSPGFTMSDLERVAQGFRGEIEQVPPMVSAVKVGGEPLYRAARRGEDVERAARKVHIYELEILNLDIELWEAELMVRCSSGTYVRTLGADLGEALGCGAHLARLRRTSVGSFTEDQAVPTTKLTPQSDNLLSLAEAMRDFPVRMIEPSERELVASGRNLKQHAATREGELPVIDSSAGISAPHTARMSAGVPVGVIDESGVLLAVYRKVRGELRPAAVLVSQSD